MSVRIRLTAALGVLAALWLMAGVTVSPAAGAVRVIYETGEQALFSLDVPDNWLVVTGRSAAGGEAPRVIGMHPEGDYSLWIGFLSPVEVKTLEEAEAYVVDMGGNIVSGGKVERIVDGKLGGLPARYYAGSGTREGAPVDFTVVITALPKQRMVIGLYVGEYGAREVYQEQILAIASSFQVEEHAR